MQHCPCYQGSLSHKKRKSVLTMSVSKTMMNIVQFTGKDPRIFFNGVCLQAIVFTDRSYFSKRTTATRRQMRKQICSLLGVFCGFLLLTHGIYAGILMIGRFPPSVFLQVLGRVLFTVLAIHVLLGLPFAVYRMVLSGRLYPRENRSMIFQQISGVLLLFFALFHTKYLSHRPTMPSLLLLLAALFCMGVHLFLGLPKFCVTTGLLTEEKDLLTARRISFFIAMLPTIFLMVAFCCYFPRFYPS